MKNILNIENLSFNYENLELFKNLNLVIKEGSFITILGSSGSGKTTLIKILKNELKHSGKTSINVSKKEKDRCYLKFVYAMLNNGNFKENYEKISDPAHKEIIKKIYKKYYSLPDVK